MCSAFYGLRGGPGGQRGCCLVQACLCAPAHIRMWVTSWHSAWTAIDGRADTKDQGRIGLPSKVVWAVGCCVLLLSAAPVRIGCFLPLPALGLVRVLPFCVVDPRPWAGSLSWSVPCGLCAVVCAVTPMPTIASLCNTPCIRGSVYSCAL